MKKLLLVLTGMIISMFLLTACGSENEDTATPTPADLEGDETVTLVMGTSADYAPFEYVDTKTGEYIGFDIDLINEIGDRLGVEIVIEDMDFSSLIPAMDAGKVDFVMAGMTPTPEREENVDFTIPYYETNNLVLVKEDSGIETVEELNGKTVGAQTGSVQLTDAETFADQYGYEVTSRDKVPELVEDLQSGRIDAVIVESPVAEKYVEEVEGLKAVEMESISDTKACAIAFPTGSEWVDEFNAVIEEMIADGTIAELEEKWFGTSTTE